MSEVKKENKVAEEIKNEATTAAKDRQGGNNKGGYQKKGGFKKKRFGRRGGARERVKPEFDQKIINIRRVTRVMAGGRRFAFSVAIVIGDKKGRVGVGLGKASDTSIAIQKAYNDAKKNLVKLKLNAQYSIDYEVQTKFSSAIVNLRPNYGRGIVAGSAVRTVLELAGIKDVTGRVISRSRNKLNNARAAFEALTPFVALRGLAAQQAGNKKQGFAQKKDGRFDRREKGKRPPYNGGQNK